MEEDLNSEAVEVTPQDQETEIEQTQDYQEENHVHNEDPQEKNWRELRRKSEDAESKARQYEEKLKAQEELIKHFLQQNRQEAAPVQKEVDPFDEIPDDEYLPKGQTRQLLQKDARAIAREEFLRLEAEREKNRFRERLQSKFSDFDEIVNPETIKIFEKKNPELAETIASLGDPYKMGLQTYNFIKAMSATGSLQEERHAAEAQKKLEKNSKAVQTPQAYSKRPMAQAFSLGNMSSDEKKALYEEMTRYASGAGSGY